MRKAASCWIPAEIHSYTQLFKSRRFWVFKNDLNRPCDIHSDAQCDQVLVYDSQRDAVIANGYWAQRRHHQRPLPLGTRHHVHQR